MSFGKQSVGCPICGSSVPTTNRRKVTEHLDPLTGVTCVGTNTHGSAHSGRADKLWVDDLRNPPGADWAMVGSSAAAISTLAVRPYRILSLDYSLGGDDTGEKVVGWLIQQDNRWPERIWLHSSSIDGRELLAAMITGHRPSQSVKLISPS